MQSAQLRFEYALDQPRGPRRLGLPNSHDRNGADVISQSGLGVEVMHPRNDEQVCRLALLGTHSIDQRAFLEFPSATSRVFAPVVATAMSRSARRPRRGRYCSAGK